ncbi:MAG: hypothetical protein WCI05_19335, partial [Myxococcales bacterium]
MRKQTVVIGALFSLLVSRPVLAEPWFGWGDGRQEDRYEDGDLDFEDLLVTRMGPKVGRSGGHARSWFSVGGVVRTAWTGERDVSVIAVVGLALDRIASPRVVPPLPPGAPTPSSEASLQRTYVTEMPRLALSPAVIRACVDAALRAAGLGSDDARLDSMAERARLGALLPEVRLRVARSFDETARSNAAASAETRYYDATGANLWLEGRLTWRLDRVLYADDQPSFERIRKE